MKVLYAAVGKRTKAEEMEREGTTMHRNAGTGHHGALDHRKLRLPGATSRADLTLFFAYPRPGHCELQAGDRSSLLGRACHRILCILPFPIFMQEQTKDTGNWSCRSFLRRILLPFVLTRPLLRGRKRTSARITVKKLQETAYGRHHNLAGLFGDN